MRSACIVVGSQVHRETSTKSMDRAETGEDPARHNLYLFFRMKMARLSRVEPNYYDDCRRAVPDGGVIP